MPETSTTVTTNSAQGTRPPKRQWQKKRDPTRAANTPDNAERPQQAPSGSADTPVTDVASHPTRNRRRRNPPKPVVADGAEAQESESVADGGADGSKLQQQQPRSRKAQFGAKLTDAAGNASGSRAVLPKTRSKPAPHPQATDLTNRLAEALSAPPYADCAICFNSIRPDQPTWSCSPSVEANACCWTSFHLKCIRAWALKSTKETREAFRARNDDSEGEWRCPGCQTKRHVVPQSYLCFCGAVNDPRPNRLSTPHSCGNPCTRRRLACDHACPLPCHPGPCPPCITTVQKPCFCTKTTLSFRCAHFSAVPAPSMSCGAPCNRPLSCGKHRCESTCHAGDCAPCAEIEYVQCYCGKERKQVSCGEGVAKSCVVGLGADAVEWEGRFECSSPCNRPFKCGIHTCPRPCHPPSPIPIPCPLDPALVTACPCGKTPLGVTRTKCTDPIPTCESTCARPMATCSHACATRCHLGPCPPCAIPIAVPCRCGETTRYVQCSEFSEGVEIFCDKVCKSLRLCGKHECPRVCCPAHSLRPKVNKSKKKALAQAAQADDAFDAMEAAWHTCELICGKTLSCELHQCEEPDHRGPCPPCLRSSFEELICKCGRTVIQPPVPCGTKIACTYPCAEPPPPCGHPKLPHACHETGACPPCVFLTSKLCACGKTSVPNVKCFQEKVSCGKPCGKPMGCGFHPCERVCHGDECGPCFAVCGKPRKHCLPAQHACASPCHAPAACDESEPCQEVVRATCECGRIQQPALCGRSSTSASGARDALKLECSQDCAIAKRNARLAEALGITPSKIVDRTAVTYPPELVQFARANASFVALVERTFSEFVASDKKSQVLPEMTDARRVFVTSLAAVYRMDTTLVDVEPHRSVQLVRRIDTRVPHPLLSQTAGPATPPAPHLGRLVDMRASQKSVAAAPAANVTSRTAKPGGAWSSIVAAVPVVPSPPPQYGSTSRLTPLPRSHSSTPLAPRSPAPTGS